jgi:hypothetical protein
MSAAILFGLGVVCGAVALGVFFVGLEIYDFFWSQER